MKNEYQDLIKQTFTFPKGGFDLNDEWLTFQGIPLKKLIEKYGTPFRITYLPKIGEQINKARHLFNQAIEKYNYKGQYQYCYCTKCNHFFHVIKEALRHQVHLETSSSYDIDLIINLLEKGILQKDLLVIHNGYKTKAYLEKIIQLQNLGFKNSITILDSKNELQRLRQVQPKNKIKIGLRMATNEEPQSAFHTSRLGIPPDEILPFFRKEIANNKQLELKMLHFFVDSGIKDNPFYWGEFQKATQLYAQLKKESNDLKALNIGGGFPIQNYLGFEYNFEHIIHKIVRNIKNTCTEEMIPEPDIFTEFGKYTVGESSAIIFEVLEKKQQNDTETWYIIDNSLLNTIPDAWGLKEKFILLPINKWNNEYQRVSIGGISCDHTDYYNSEDLNQEILLPKYEDGDPPLYLGFFHTGAYQDAVSGYGGIKHCLIPSPKSIIIDRDEHGNFIDYIFSDEPSSDTLFQILGYR
ncbi:MAG TPA: arginine decarboxylase [Saprospiraceae bacterium]|nr:arginine decarboxylase [Saprospiraceae bacterium]